mmetsp:Transcript_95760/g.271056  ORF Transcript_95760/g.271056 Transcript_95760/m.271056 type:complete len:110 (-) Transcript_95760:179-508(-)
MAAPATPKAPKFQSLKDRLRNHDFRDSAGENMKFPQHHRFFDKDLGISSVGNASKDSLRKHRHRDAEGPDTVKVDKHHRLFHTTCQTDVITIDKDAVEPPFVAPKKDEE